MRRTWDDVKKISTKKNVLVVGVRVWTTREIRLLRRSYRTATRWSRIVSGFASVFSLFLSIRPLCQCWSKIATVLKISFITIQRCLFIQYIHHIPKLLNYFILFWIILRSFILNYLKKNTQVYNNLVTATVLVNYTVFVGLISINSAICLCCLYARRNVYSAMRCDAMW